MKIKIKYALLFLISFTAFVSGVQAAETDSLNATMKLIEDGFRANDKRIEVSVENIQNQNVTPTKPGEKPPARKMISYKSVKDKETGVETVRIGRVFGSSEAPNKVYKPNHPAANEDGYVFQTKIDHLTEGMNVKEATINNQALMNAFVNTRKITNNRISLIGQ
jgi:flagellar basal-body rod protein FlgC